MKDERRKTGRVTGPFDGTWDGASGKHNFRITDIGIGGAYLESSAAVPGPGARVTIEVQIGTHRVRLTSEVIYLDRAGGFGVRFVDNAQEAREALMNALSELKRR